MPPSPEIFEAALEQAGSDPKFMLVVGDTPYERELLVKAEFLFDDVEDLVRKIDRVDDYFSE